MSARGRGLWLGVLTVFCVSCAVCVFGSAAALAAAPTVESESFSDVGSSSATLSATVTVPRNAFAQPTIVTLTLVAFAPVNNDAGVAGPSGPIGQIFSLSKTDALLRSVTLQSPASFQLKFTPADTSIPVQRVVLAYLQTNPNLWIAITGSSYDASTGVLTGSVFEFSETRLFAPVESCLTGQACSAPQTCQGGACQ